VARPGDLPGTGKSPPSGTCRFEESTMPPEPVEVTHTSVFANGSRGGNPCPVILDAADLGPEQM
jgi:hypothetical protein